MRQINNKVFLGCTFSNLAFFLALDINLFFKYIKMWLILQAFKLSKLFSYCIVFTAEGRGSLALRLPDGRVLFGVKTGKTVSDSSSILEESIGGDNSGDSGQPSFMGEDPKKEKDPKNKDSELKSAVYPHQPEKMYHNA